MPLHAEQTDTDAWTADQARQAGDGAGGRRTADRQHPRARTASARAAVLTAALTNTARALLDVELRLTDFVLDDCVAAAQAFTTAALHPESYHRRCENK